ncbi:hypothetical protein ACH5RR_037259 [Cinchona calisaya]|uniref:Uncharacterized protein n=1 Tax=Cinchona calisaya TaxID=153742 RepID=A0ABD2YAG0_9GENT
MSSTYSSPYLVDSTTAQETVMDDSSAREIITITAAISELDTSCAAVARQKRKNTAVTYVDEEDIAAATSLPSTIPIRREKIAAASDHKAEAVTTLHAFAAVQDSSETGLARIGVSDELTKPGDNALASFPIYVVEIIVSDNGAIGAEDKIIVGIQEKVCDDATAQSILCLPAQIKGNNFLAKHGKIVTSCKNFSSMISVFVNAPTKAITRSRDKIELNIYTTWMWCQS